MRIDCPHCGTRDGREFVYLGDAGKKRPNGLDADAGAMFDYLYLRDNPAGPHCEFWYHGSGCHAWLIVTRDTRTHEITDVRAARGEPSDLRKGAAS